MTHNAYDVVIIGGGVSGMCAALAASRLGARTLLVEKYGYPGGMATGAWVHSMLTFHGKKGHKIIGGIPEEIVQNLVAIEGSPGHIRDTIGVAYSVTPTSPDKLKYVFLSMLAKSQVNPLFNTLFIKPLMEGNKIRSVVLENAGGTFNIKGKVFVDASGEGILAQRAGNEFESGQDGKTQPVTLIFKVRNVNMNEVIDNILKDKKNFHHETLFHNLHESSCPGVSGFFKEWKKGKLSVPRDRILFYQTTEHDEVAINTTRVRGSVDPLDPVDMLYAQREARRQMYEIFSFLKKEIPGFQKSILTGEAPLLGLREVRRIKGKYVLTEEDLLYGRRFPDEVVLGGFPIDIHQPAGKGIESEEIGGEGFYGIPYGSLLSGKTSNLFITGKCFSATFKAHASARVQATSMAMGQAVGTAASLSVKEKTDPPDLSVEMVRKTLIENKAILQPEKPSELRF